MTAGGQATAAEQRWKGEEVRSLRRAAARQRNAARPAWRAGSRSLVLIPTLPSLLLLLWVSVSSCGTHVCGLSVRLPEKDSSSGILRGYPLHPSALPSTSDCSAFPCICSSVDTHVIVSRLFSLVVLY